MDDSIEGGAEPGREHGRALRPVRQKVYARFAPDVQARRGAAQHKIGTVRADALSHIGE